MPGVGVRGGGSKPRGVEEGVFSVEISLVSSWMTLMKSERFRREESTLASPSWWARENTALSDVSWIRS